MTNYRRLDSSELIQWGDEVWQSDGAWLPIDSKGLALTLVGRRTQSLIVRRQVELMNRNPTDEELSSLPYPYKADSRVRTSTRNTDLRPPKDSLAESR